MAFFICFSGSLAAAIEMKMILSIPKMISKKVVYGGIFAASVFAGAVGEIILPGYGKDIAYSIQSYTGCRFVGFDLNPLECATVGFVSSSAGEFSQYFSRYVTVSPPTIVPVLPAEPLQKAYIDLERRLS